MSWLVYGAYGYTGELVARLAVARGERPVLAGRDAARVRALADELGLEHRVFDLAGIDLTGVDVVAHCAGPFSATARPMVEACLAAGVHYLDVTGEIDVFEDVFTRHDEAVARGVVLLPGAGFDVVPTDCLAAMLAAALPGATELDLAFRVGGGLSRGTAMTSLESVAVGGRVRIDGKITGVPLAHRRRTVPFASGPRTVPAIPWGDVSTAYRTTGIPTITTYGDIPTRGAGVFRIPAVRGLARFAAGAVMTGPGRRRRERTGCEVWGEARDAAGDAVTASLTGPNPYDLTADSVVRAAGRITRAEPGAHTPATAFGADFVTELDGVTVQKPSPPDRRGAR